MEETSEDIRNFLTIAIRGRFKVLTAENKDVTPKNRKERGILALLAMSDDHRRSRLWLQSMLWSEKEPSKSAGSLRTALKNLRKSLPTSSSLIESDRHEVWLSNRVKLDYKPSLATKRDLLEMVDAPDPAFDDWLRELRAADANENDARPLKESRPPTNDENSDETVVIINAQSGKHEGASSFLETTVVDAMSARFEAEGAQHVFAYSKPDPLVLARAASVIHIEIMSTIEHGFWAVHLRALAGKDRRFLWAGRLQRSFEPKMLLSGMDIQAFTSRAISQILARYRSYCQVRTSSLMLITRAASRLYDPSQTRVAAAEEDLVDCTNGEIAPIALAWQGFAKLARYFEFRDLSGATEAENLLRESLSRRPDGALNSSIASRVALDVSDDPDYADFLATRAMQADEGNPYSLQAAARVAMRRGEFSKAHEHALRARKAADGLPHVFAWDIELCLTALANEDFVGAQDAVRQAHRGNARHRASLRYLVATSLLVGDIFEAKHAADRLAKLEKGFGIARLFDDDYPVVTLQKLGLVDVIRNVPYA